MIEVGRWLRRRGLLNRDGDKHEPSERSAEMPATEEPAIEGTSKPCSRTGIDWASRLRRVYDLDALACRCGGRLRVIALITERSVSTAILDSVGLPSQPLPIARARSPDDHDSAAQ
jgi:hypothetical protein